MYAVFGSACCLQAHSNCTSGYQNILALHQIAYMHLCMFWVAMFKHMSYPQTCHEMVWRFRVHSTTDDHQEDNQPHSCEMQRVCNTQQDSFNTCENTGWPCAQHLHTISFHIPLQHATLHCCNLRNSEYWPQTSHCKVRVWTTAAAIRSKCSWTTNSDPISTRSQKNEKYHWNHTYNKIAELFNTDNKHRSHYHSAIYKHGVELIII